MGKIQAAELLPIDTKALLQAAGLLRIDTKAILQAAKLLTAPNPWCRLV